MENVFNLTVRDFSILFGIDDKDMPQQCIDIITSKDFRYSFFKKEERDKIIIDMMKRIDFNGYTVSGIGKKERWENGWQEIYDNFVLSGYNKNALIPQYNKQGMPVRLFGDYVRSYDPNFENNFIELIRTFIFYKYIEDKNSIYEFGSGSGYNLIAFAEMSPKKYYYGCDWVDQSMKIIDKIRDHCEINVYGGVFDMFDPDYSMNIKEDSVAVTIGSLEQLGSNFDKFMEFLLSKPFSRFVHLNSILEEYDIDNNITDYLTYRFEKARNYCNGFFNNLKLLEKKNIIKIHKMTRVPCGGLLGDGYSITIWDKI